MVAHPDLAYAAGHQWGVRYWYGKGKTRTASSVGAWRRHWHKTAEGIVLSAQTKIVGAAKGATQ